MACSFFVVIPLSADIARGIEPHDINDQNHHGVRTLNEFLNAIRNGKIRGPPPSDPAIMEYGL